MIGAFRIAYECLGGSKNTSDVLLQQIVIHTQFPYVIDYVLFDSADVVLVLHAWDEVREA
jgi:hypothetical protein